jgi:hypothetical protein
MIFKAMGPMVKGKASVNIFLRSEYKVKEALLKDTKAH